MLRKRPDLFANVAGEIDGVLGSPAPMAASVQLAAAMSSGEDVVKEINATLHTATVNYTGKMAITKQRLVFQGEYLTKTQRLEIPIADIQEVKKGLALLSASPTIIVKTRDGREHSFSVQGFGGLLYGNREEIISLIQGMLSR
jgi:hypothetical protein